MKYPYPPSGLIHVLAKGGTVAITAPLYVHAEGLFHALNMTLAELGVETRVQLSRKCLRVNGGGSAHIIQEPRDARGWTFDGAWAPMGVPDNYVEKAIRANLVPQKGEWWE